MIGKVVRKLVSVVSIYRRKKQLAKQGVSFLEPNYIFFDNFDASSVIIDAGCGTDAELAMHFTIKHGLKAYGIDPTQKHQNALMKLEQKSEGNFQHIKKAVASNNVTLTFYESKTNESGSLLTDHINVLSDQTNEYEVETITLNDLKRFSPTGQLDFVKLDLEGAEYELFDGIELEDLAGIKQLFVEFHHHCLPRYTKAHTQQIVKKIEQAGLKTLTVDEHNFLFYNDRLIT